MALFTILCFRDVGQVPEPAAQEIMTVAAEHLVSKQQADGSWLLTRLVIGTKRREFRRLKITLL